MSSHKKNLGGGKGHKKQSNKERAGPRKNREFAVAFIEDVESGEVIEGLTIAKVEKNFGGGRSELLTMEGKVTIAGLKGSLRCSKGAVKHADNPIAIFRGSYVLLQDEGYAQQIIGILTRPQVKQLEKHFPKASKGFFNMTSAEPIEEAAWDWDEEDEEVDVDGI